MLVIIVVVIVVRSEKDEIQTDRSVDDMTPTTQMNVCRISSN